MKVARLLLLAAAVAVTAAPAYAAPNLRLRLQELRSASPEGGIDINTLPVPATTTSGAAVATSDVTAVTEDVEGSSDGVSDRVEDLRGTSK